MSRRFADERRYAAATFLPRMLTVRRVAICALGLATIIGCGQARQRSVESERAVIRAVLDSSYTPSRDGSVPDVVVRERFAPFELEAGWEQWLRDSVPQLPSAVVREFKRVSKDSSAVVPFAIGRGRIRVLPDSTLRRIFRRGPGPDRWEMFRAAYPDAGAGIVTLVHVGISADGKWALTYIDSQGDWLTGAGYLVVLHQIGEIWHPVRRARLRIS